MKELLRKAILAWFDDLGEWDYKHVDDPNWVDHVCDCLGITEDIYFDIMREEIQ